MSAARVYLFAVRGSSAVPILHRVLGKVEAEEVRNGTRTLVRLFAARAWWLVECESAEAGRQVIAMYGGPTLSAINAPGRILASGGAA